jgi:hypothetical protein
MIFLYLFLTITELFLHVKGYSQKFAEILSISIYNEEQRLSVLVIDVNSSASQMDSHYHRIRDCVAILICHCEFTTVNVAIQVLSRDHEIASVVTFPRKDITTQSLTRDSSTYKFQCTSFLKLESH